MPPRTVYLTGATGFIGSRLASRLAAQGDRLRCLVREGSDTRELEKLGAELVTGDLASPADHERGMAGSGLAFHLAATYDIGVVDSAGLDRTNVDGTQAFLDAVERSGIPRAVYVSSTVALGPAPAGAAEGSADTDYRGPYPSAYHRTKAEAHRLARGAQSHGLPVIIACPAYVYGPGDRGPGGRFVEDLLRGRVPGLLATPASFSFVHVDDVVDGLIRIAERGRIGATYVLDGEPRDINAFAADVARVAGRRPPLLRFPVPLAGLTGRALDLVTRVTGIRFPISRESVAVAARHRWLHDASASRADLEWAPRPLADGLPEAVAWHGAHLSRADVHP